MLHSIIIKTIKKFTLIIFMILHFYFSVKFNIKCSQSSYNFHLISRLIILEKLLSRFLGNSIHIDCTKKGKIYNPILFLLISIIYKLKHLPPYKLIISINKYCNLVSSAIVMNCILNVISCKHLLLIS